MQVNLQLAGKWWQEMPAHTHTQTHSAEPYWLPVWPCPAYGQQELFPANRKWSRHKLRLEVTPASGLAPGSSSAAQLWLCSALLCFGSWTPKAYLIQTAAVKRLSCGYGWGATYGDATRRWSPLLGRKSSSAFSCRNSDCLLSTAQPRVCCSCIPPPFFFSFFYF